MIRVVQANHFNINDLWILTRELHDDAVKKYPFTDNGMDHRGVLQAYHRVLGWTLDLSNVVLMAYDDALAVGYMHLQMVPFVGSENSNIGSSIGFYVKPEYRAGKATALLYRTARKVLQANQKSFVQAVVLTANTETNKLYEDHGYKPVATIWQRDIRTVRPGVSDERKLERQEVLQGDGGGGQHGSDGTDGSSE